MSYRVPWRAPQKPGPTLWTRFRDWWREYWRIVLVLVGVSGGLLTLIFLASLQPAPRCLPPGSFQVVCRNGLLPMSTGKVVVVVPHRFCRQVCLTPQGTPQ